MTHSKTWVDLWLIKKTDCQHILRPPCFSKRRSRGVCLSPKFGLSVYVCMWCVCGVSVSLSVCLRASHPLILWSARMELLFLFIFSCGCGHVLPNEWITSMHALLFMGVDTSSPIQSNPAADVNFGFTLAPFRPIMVVLVGLSVPSCCVCPNGSHWAHLSLLAPPEWALKRPMRIYFYPIFAGS